MHVDWYYVINIFLTHNNKCWSVVFVSWCLFACAWGTVYSSHHPWQKKKGFGMLVFIAIHWSRRFRNSDSNVEIMFSLCFLLHGDHHRVGLHVTTSPLCHKVGVKWQSANVKQGEMLILVWPLYGRPRSALHPPLLLLDLQKASDEWGDATEAMKGETKHQRSRSLPNFAQA